MMPAKSISKRIIELDALRGIAILSVVIFHYTTWYDKIYGHSATFIFNFPLGYLGVQLFFIISGFSILMRHEKTKNAFNFAINRFSRLFPSYWIAVILIFTAASLFSLPGREIGFKSFLANFTMLQHWSGIPDVDGAFWILPIILTFYFLFFIAITINKVKKIELFSTIWMIFGMILWLKQIPNQNSLQTIFIFFKYAHLFIAGMIFYRLKTGKKKLLSLFLLISTLIPQFTLFNHTESLTVVCFYIIMFLLITGRLSWLSNKALTFIGLISYQFYLVHSNIGYIIINQLYRLEVANWLILLIPIFISLMLSIVIFYCIEKPLRAKIRTICQKRHICF